MTVKMLDFRLREGWIANKEDLRHA